MRTQIPPAKLNGPLYALIAPIPNMNGNSRESLVEAAWGVARALDEVQTAMQAAFADLGHGRNFQTMGKAGDDEAMQARERLRQRFNVVAALQGEFQALALAIQEGGR